MSLEILTRIHKGATKRFTVSVLAGGEAQSITGDHVILVLIHQDTREAFSFEAEVSEFGAQGVAVFVLNTDDTDTLDTGYYLAQVTWEDGDDIHIVLEGFIAVVELLNDGEPEVTP